MFKTIFRLVTVFISLTLALMLFRPASEAEIATLGTNPAIYNLAQMRAAQGMMHVAPNATIDLYARVTGLPHHLVLGLLTAKANGQDIAAVSQNAPEQPSNVRVLDGGAKFITAD